MLANAGQNPAFVGSSRHRLTLSPSRRYSIGFPSHHALYASRASFSACSDVLLITAPPLKFFGTLCHAIADRHEGIRSRCDRGFNPLGNNLTRHVRQCRRLTLDGLHEVNQVWSSVHHHSPFPQSGISSPAIDGITFASKREAQRYAQLRLAERAGEITHLERQPEYKVRINGHLLCTYRADFRYFRNGQRIVEDCKSDGTAKDTAYRLRKRAAELAHFIKVVEVGK